MSNKETRKRRKPGTVMILLGVLLIAISLGLVLYNNWESDRAGQASEVAVTDLESIIFNNQLNLNEGAQDAQ